MSNQGRGRPEDVAVSKEAQERPERKTERVSMAKGVNLDVEVTKGYIGRWANSSIEGRIDRLLQAGYEFMVDAEGNQIKRSKGGSDLILMKIPEQFWREDIELGQKKIDQQVNEQQRLGKDEYSPQGLDDNGRPIVLSSRHGRDSVI